MDAQLAFATHPQDLSPVLNVHTMVKRTKASARVGGEYFQVSQDSESLTTYVCRHEDRAERRLLAAAEDQAALAQPARDWLTPKEVAALLGTSANTIRRMATRSRDVLPARRPTGGDGRLEIPLADLLSYQSEHGWSTEALAVLESRARAILVGVE